MAGRRNNGEGTIYRRKDGRFEGAAYLLATSGQRKRVRVYGKTRGEVFDKLSAAQDQVRRGIPVPNKTWQLGEYLDYWLREVVQPTLRPTTLERYATNVRLYLKPRLGECTLVELTVPRVQAFLNDHIATGHSVRSAQIVRTTLSAALTAAQREELVVRNVARLAQLPTYERGDIVPWTRNEAQEFLRAAQTDQLSAAFTLLLYGLRRGEVLGVRWQDVDFERDIIKMRQQVVRVGGALHIGPVKTRAGRRDLPMLGLARSALLFHRHSRQTVPSSNDLVFTTRSGQPIEPRNFVRSFKRICKTHDIRPIRLHDIRHTAATLLKDLGVPVRDAQLILGHASLSTTQEIYQHDTLETRRTALTKLEQLFYRSAGSVRCRQLSRQGTQIVDQITSFIFGSGERTRTSDPRLMSSISASPSDRLTAVKLVMDVRTRQWIIGAVAVKLAVNVDDADPISEPGISP